MGDGIYALSMFERLIRVTKPLDNNYVVAITMEPDADYELILDSISTGLI